MQRLKDKEDALTKAERNIVSRDKVINELRLRLPAAANRERLLANATMQEESDVEIALKMAQQTIGDLQERLEKKEDVLKKYHNQLSEARQVPDGWWVPARRCAVNKTTPSPFSSFAGAGKHHEGASGGA